MNQLAGFEGTGYGPMELDIIPNFHGFYFITLRLQNGGHMDLCGGGSTLACLNLLSPESNACSDMQKTGIEMGPCKGRYKYNVWHFGHCCACMLHILYTTFRARVSVES